MKKLLLILMMLVPVLTYSLDPTCCSKNKSGKKCTGSSNCTACTNCSGCKYCNSGGNCGVCSSGKSAPSRTGKSKSISSQCQAITKKGTQCSRAASSGGYCWQHGG